MTYLVLEIQELNGVPVITSKPLSDSSDIKEAMSVALLAAGYWMKPPAGITPPPSVTVILINERGREVPGYRWNFEFEQPAAEEPEQDIPVEE